MKFLRNRFVSRTISVFLLLVFVQSLILPEYAFALTSGPHQPEYTSYEEPGATDLVNLLTGDFSFNLPVLDIPDPEGSFSLPLSYHAGIGLEQEATWVGLGWNVNAGAIVRDINQYPDDALGEANTVTVQNLTGTNGYDIQWAAPYKQSWNSVQGKYGNVNLLDIVEVEWGRQSSVGIVGFHVGGDGESFKLQQFISGVMSIASLGSGATVAEVAKKAALQLGIQASGALTAAAISPGVSNSSTIGHWAPTVTNRKSVTFSGNPLTGFIGIKNSWKIWLDRTRQEDMFGVLYSHKPQLVPINTFGNIAFGGWVGTKISVNGSLQNPLPSFEQSTNTIEKGSASDVNFTINPIGNYQSQNSPILLANDQYTVNAPGISGSISPYRLEVGAVSMPREMTEKHVRLAAIPFLDYKVPFVYEGSATNQYFHHVGGSAAPSVPTPNYGIPKTGGGSTSWGGSTWRYTEFDVQDYTLTTERIRGDIDAIKKIPQANHIEWMSNLDIASGVTYESKFLDFLPSPARSAFRSNSPNGIGGYCITAPDGQTYHFALPVYTLNETTESVKATDPNQKSIIVRTSPFANTWLLTAITGPDFVDRNENGIADDEDWGFWRKFNYGKHADSYDWRTPYDDDNTETILDPAGQFKNYTKGQKQLYYLNSIESRSHVALFIKSTREDGRSAANTGITQLKLDEIVLLKKDHYKQLGSSFGLPNYSDGINVVCNSSQITTEIRNYLERNCMKRVIFTYDYSLCKNTPNANGSNNPLKGKLTLKKVGVKGRNNVSLHPDYKFEYASNPNYSANAWDGWGMYKDSGLGHATPQNNNNPGAAWSLTRMITPLGGELLVNYERDTYASISGHEVLSAGKSFSRFNFDSDEFSTLYRSNDDAFQEGDRVRVHGNATYTCGGNSDSRSQSGDFIVSDVTSNYILIDGNLITPDCPPGENIHVDGFSGTIHKIYDHKKGGNLRVGSIVMRDESGKENRVSYLYNNEDGKSSGVVAQEPAFIRESDMSFYNQLNYPMTPVIYGRVSVLNGESNNSPFTSKQIFEFETPNTTHYVESRQNEGSDATLNDGYLFTLVDRTSQIGRLKKIILHDRNGLEISRSEMQYTEQINNNEDKSYQGLFTEGTVQFEMYNPAGKTLMNPGSPNSYYAFVPDKVRINRTTLIRYPYALKKVVNTKDGFTSMDENLKWDFVSGQVIENLRTSALGLNVKTVLVPAYRIQPYSSMGSKAVSINNKNMLSQVAGEYVYRSDASGNPTGLISAQVQTWKNDWSNYRYFDGDAYIDHNQEISIDNPVWRKSKAYIWKGDYSRVDPTLNAAKDGTHLFSPDDEFNFSAAPASEWQYAGENERFDHFGMPVETKDLNNVSSAVKMGYGERIVIASAVNAKYNEIAFSSAEDLFYPVLNKPYFGGEIGLENGIVKYLSRGQTTSTHTGDAVVAVTSGHSFVFKTSGLTAQRNYKSSVWTNNSNGRIYYKVNGGDEVIPSDQTISASVNGWHRIDVLLPKQSSDYAFEIGVKSVNDSEVYFDDFRFQPVESLMTCYVYPPLGFEFTASSPTSYYTYALDNDNIYSKFEHNERGMLVRTYRESIKYGVKLVSESKDNYRRFTIPN